MFIKKIFSLNDKQAIKICLLLSICTILFCVYDLQPLLQAISAMKKEEQHLKMALKQLPVHSKKLSGPTIIVPLTEKNLLVMFTHEISQYHLELIDLQWENEKNASPEKNLRATLTGQFIHFAQWVSDSQSLGLRIHLNHVNYQLNENHEPMIQVDLSLFAEPITTKNFNHLPAHASMPVHSYFCAPLSDPLTTQPSFSIHDFKMVGFLKQQHRTEALITLPNQNLIIVSPGMIVGQEKARVLAIAPNAVDMQLPNQSIYRIEKI